MSEKPSGVAESNATAADLSRQFEQYKEANPGWKSYTLLPGSPWVSVKERLPERTGGVLVWDELEMFQAAFTNGGDRTLPYFYHSQRGHLPYVTHWQPLPEKPEVK
jgi:hypothetical protein